VYFCANPITVYSATGQIALFFTFREKTIMIIDDEKTGQLETAETEKLKLSVAILLKKDHLYK